MPVAWTFKVYINKDKQKVYKIADKKQRNNKRLDGRETMDELKVEIALEVIQLKIVHFIKNNKEKDVNKFKKQLNILTTERDKIYELDEETIDKVYNVYLE